MKKKSSKKLHSEFAKNLQFFYQKPTKIFDIYIKIIYSQNQDSFYYNNFWERIGVLTKFPENKLRTLA